MSYAAWEIQDFSGGINEKVESHLLSNNQCASAVNAISPKQGRLQKRKGQAKLNAAAVGTGIVLGLHSYYYTDTNPVKKLIAVFNNGTMYYWNGTGFTSTGKTGLNATAQVQFATCVNYCVGMNGVNAPWKYDGTSVTNLNNAPATGKCPVLYGEKVFCIVDKDTIQWSDSFLPETWPGVNISMDFEKGDGDELVAIHKYGGGLLICKKHSLFRLAGTSIENFRITKVEGIHGVAGMRAGVALEPYFYFISDGGIFRWDGLTATNILNPSGNSPGLPDTWDGVNKAALGQSVAYYNKYYDAIEFHVPYGTSQATNNLALVYCLKTGSWWKFDKKTVSCAVLFDNKLYTGSAVSGYVIEQNAGYNDLGVAISADWQGPNFCGDSPMQIKKFHNAFAEDVKSLNDATFQHRLDSNASWVTLAHKTDTNDVRRYTGFIDGSKQHAKGRFFQPRFTHETIDADFALSGFKLHYRAKRDK